MTIEIDETLAAAIESHAAHRGMTVEQVATEALKSWLVGAVLAGNMVAAIKRLVPTSEPATVSVPDNVIPFCSE